MEINGVIIMEATNTIKDFLTIKDFIKLHSDVMNENKIRWLLENRKHNNAEYFATKIGREWLIHVPRLHEWMMNNLQDAA